MTRPDALAAQVARNVQHAKRLGALYRTVREPDPDPEALRRQIRDAAQALAVADLTTAAAIEDAGRAVQGLARVVAQLRPAIEARGGSHAP